LFRFHFNVRTALRCIFDTADNNLTHFRCQRCTGWPKQLATAELVINLIESCIKVCHMRLDFNDGAERSIFTCSELGVCSNN